MARFLIMTFATVRRISMAAVLVAATLTTVSCAPGASDRVDEEPAGSTSVVDSGAESLAALGAVELVAALERVPIVQRRSDLTVSVRPDRVILTDGDGETVVPAPDSQHYLSIAPYVETTHECYFHSLTTCTGELGGEEITLRIVNDDTGEIYIDQAVELEDNGFTGVWLPADVRATVMVTSALGAGTTSIATGDEDLTCLTSLRLT